MSGEEPVGIDARSGLAGVRAARFTLFPSIDSSILRALRNNYSDEGLVLETPSDEPSFWGTFKGTFATGTTGSIYSGIGQLYNDAFVFKEDGTDPNSVLSEEERSSGYFNGANSLDHVQYLREQRYNVLNQTSEAGKIFSSWGSFGGGFLAGAVDVADWVLYAVGAALARVAITAVNPALGVAITLGTAAPFLTKFLANAGGRAGLNVTGSATAAALANLRDVPSSALLRYIRRSSPLKSRLITRGIEAVTTGVLAEGSGAIIRTSFRSDLDWVDGLIDTAVGTAIGTVFILPGAYFSGRNINVDRRISDEGVGLEIDEPDVVTKEGIAYYGGNTQIDSKGRTAYYEDGGTTLTKDEGFDEDSMRPLVSPVADPVRQEEIVSAIGRVSNYVEVPLGAPNRYGTRRIDRSARQVYIELRKRVAIKLRRKQSYSNTKIDDLLNGYPPDAIQRLYDDVNVTDEQKLLRDTFREVGEEMLKDGEIEAVQLRKKLTAMSFDGAFSLTKPDIRNPILGISYTNTPSRSGNFRVVTMTQFLGLRYSGRGNNTDINNLIIIGQKTKGRSNEFDGVLRFDSVESFNSALRNNVRRVSFTYTSFGYENGRVVRGLPGADPTLSKRGDATILTGDNGQTYVVFPQIYRFNTDYNRRFENNEFPVGGMTIRANVKDVGDHQYVELYGNYNKNETAQISNSGVIGDAESNVRVSLFNNPEFGVENYEITFELANISKHGKNPWTQGISRAVTTNFRNYYKLTSKINQDIVSGAKSISEANNSRVVPTELTDGLGLEETNSIVALLNGEFGINVLVDYVRAASVREGRLRSRDEILASFSDRNRTTVPYIYTNLLRNGIDIRKFSVNAFELTDELSKQNLSLDEFLLRIQRMEANYTLSVLNNETGGNVFSRTAIGITDWIRTIGIGKQEQVANLLNKIAGPMFAQADHTNRIIQLQTGSSNYVGIKERINKVTERLVFEGDLLVRQAEGGVTDIPSYKIKLNRAVTNESVFSDMKAQGDVNGVQYVTFMRESYKRVRAHLETDLDINNNSFRLDALSNAVIKNDVLKEKLRFFARGLAVNERSRKIQTDLDNYADDYVREVESQTSVPHLNEFVDFLEKDSPDLFNETFYKQYPHQYLSEEGSRYYTVAGMRLSTGARGRTEFVDHWDFMFRKMGLVDKVPRMVAINFMLGLFGANTQSPTERMVNNGYVRHILNFLGAMTRLLLSFGGVYDITQAQKILAQNNIIAPGIVNFTKNFSRRVMRVVNYKDTSRENINNLQAVEHISRLALIPSTDGSTFSSVIQSGQGVSLKHASGRVGSGESVGTGYLARIPNTVNNLSNIRTGTSTLNGVIRNAIPVIMGTNIVLARDSVEDFIRLTGKKVTPENIDAFFNDASSVRFFTDTISGKQLGVFLNESGLGLREALDIMKEFETYKGRRIVDVSDLVEAEIPDGELSHNLVTRLSEVNNELESLYTTSMNAGDLPAWMHSMPLLSQLVLQFISYAFSAQSRRFIATASNPNGFYNLYWIQAAASVSEGLQVLKINSEEDDEKRVRALRSYNQTNALFARLKHYGSVADFGLAGLIASEISRVGTKPINFGSNIPFAPPLLGTVDDVFGVFSGSGSNRAERGFFSSITHSANRISDRYLFHETSLGLLLPDVKDVLSAMNPLGWVQ